MTWKQGSQVRNPANSRIALPLDYLSIRVVDWNPMILLWQYAGEWASDKPNGYGGETGVDWSVYVGQWQDDDKHGMGIYTFAD
eukprot:439708-Rhodomonas_salina.1